MDYGKENLYELYVFSFIFSLVHILDVLSTFLFIKMGGQEGNIIPALVFDLIGFNNGVIFVTVFFSVFLMFIYRYCKIKEFPYVLNVGMFLSIVIKSYIVMDNLIFISTFF